MKLALQRIKKTLENDYHSHIDISDISAKKIKDKIPYLNTRSMASFVIKSLFDLTPIESSSYICDGFKDDGIDAIYFSQTDKTIHLFQTKFSSSNRSFSEGDVHKLINGVKKLLNPDYKSENIKLKKLYNQLVKPNLEDINAKIVLHLIYTSSQRLEKTCEQLLSSFCEDQNIADEELITYKCHSLDNLYSYLLDNSNTSIESTLNITQWGIHSHPYTSYTGFASALELCHLYDKYGAKMFDKNIRTFLGDSEINESICYTVKVQPEHFWYYNNGVIALADKVKKHLKGGNSRDFGEFKVEGLNIVNGAQTIGSLYSAFKEDPSYVESLKVQFRLIELKDAPEGFSENVTQFSNKQNRIDARDFVSMDPTHQKIKSELLFDNVDYMYKRGDSSPSFNSDSFTFEEAAIALACFKNYEYARISKREVGLLWKTDDIYNDLFPKDLNPTFVWNTVQVSKAVNSIHKSLLERLDNEFTDEQLLEIETNLMVEDWEKRAQNILLHCERFSLYALYKSLTRSSFYKKEFNVQKIDIRSIYLANVHKTLICFINKYSNTYPLLIMKKSYTWSELDKLVFSSEAELTSNIGPLFDSKQMKENTINTY